MERKARSFQQKDKMIYFSPNLALSNPITSLGLLKEGFTRAIVSSVYIIYLYEEWVGLDLRVGRIRLYINVAFELIVSV